MEQPSDRSNRALGIGLESKVSQDKNKLESLKRVKNPLVTRLDLGNILSHRSQTRGQYGQVEEDQPSSLDMIGLLRIKGSV